MIIADSVPRLVAVDEEALHRRARELAAGQGADDAEAAGSMSLVAFGLRGRPCAVDAGLVSRAVVLAAPLWVPGQSGSGRVVAFVEERPLEVVDLASAAGGSPRTLAELAGAPALVVGTSSGPVAVAVEGPLDLHEDRLAAASAPSSDPGPIRIAGRLAGGAVLIDGGWLAAWAGKAGSP